MLAWVRTAVRPEWRTELGLVGYCMAKSSFGVPGGQMLAPRWEQSGERLPAGRQSVFEQGPDASLLYAVPESSADRLVACGAQAKRGPA